MDERRTTASLETITPEQAANYLARQAPNRPSRERHLQRMARDMAMGRWRINGETVKFFADGRMADGQNRMLACIRANASFCTWVIRGLDVDDRDNVDLGARRTLGDVFTLRGRAHARVLGAAVGWVSRLRAGGAPDSVNYPTAAEAEQIIQNTSVLDSVEKISELHGQTTSRIAGAGLLAGLHCVFAEDIGKLEADQFFTPLITGTEVKIDSVIHMLRNRLLEPKHRLMQAEQAAIIIKAFVGHRSGRVYRISGLRWRRSGPAAEQFPSWVG